jgi:pimeloyl-ACP methyl ester carboxylesterase
MKQDFISTNGLTIAYQERNPTSDKTIFFIHGNSGSSRMWERQLSSDLFKDYRLIAFDLPGHGKSFSSKNPDDDYSPIGTAKILSEAVKILAGTKPFIFVGFSYGSNLVTEILEYKVIPSGIVLVGSCVIGINHSLEKLFVPTIEPSIFFYNETDKRVVTKFLKQAIHPVDIAAVENLIEDYLDVSAEFKSSLFKTAAQGKISDEILALQKLNIPVCLIFGREDNLVNIDYLDDKPFPLWRNQIYKLPEAGHWANIDNPVAVNRLISDYVSEIVTINHA